MDIHIVTPRFHPVVGGIETNLTVIGSRAVERGHTVTVHTIRHDPELAPEDGHQGMAIRRYDPARELGYYTTVFEPDLPDDAVIHLNAFGQRTNDWVLDRHPHEHIVFSTHHGLSFPTIPVLGEIYYAWYRRRFVPKLADVHKITTSNRFDRERLVKRGIDPGKVEVLPNGVWASDFEPAEQAQAPADRYVAYLGRINEEKGVADLLRIAPRLDAPVILAGPDDGYSRELEALARELGVEDQVSFPGLLSEDEKKAFLAGANVLVLPGEHEAQGIVLMEAWAQGTPVVAWDVDGPRHMIDDGQDGFVLPLGDLEALAETVQGLLDDESGARSMGKRGRERMREAYRWEDLADRAVDIYEEVPL